MSLAITVQELRREVARYLGYGPVSGLDSRQTDNVNDVVRKGVREFYFGYQDGEPHDWSFLRKHLPLELSSGQFEYDLPADFIRITHRPTISGTDYPLRLLPESLIRSQRQQGSESGDPLYVAIVPNGNESGTGRPLNKLQVYPVPDEVKTLDLWYLHDPGLDMAATSNLLGSAAYAQAISFCCLSQAEQMFNVESLGSASGFYTTQARMAKMVAVDQDRSMQGLPPVDRRPPEPERAQQQEG